MTYDNGFGSHGAAQLLSLTIIARAAVPFVVAGCRLHGCTTTGAATTGVGPSGDRWKQTRRTADRKSAEGSSAGFADGSQLVREFASSRVRGFASEMRDGGSCVHGASRDHIPILIILAQFPRQSPPLINSFPAPRSSPRSMLPCSPAPPLSPRPSQLASNHARWSSRSRRWNQAGQ